MPTPSGLAQRSRSQDELAIGTLEDDHSELEPRQVWAALQHSGRCQAATRELCMQTVTAIAPLEQQQPASSAKQEASQQHRRWWPKSNFCLPAPVVLSTSAMSSSRSSAAIGTRRPLLEPHQVLQVSRTGSIKPQQPQQGMKPAARGGTQPSMSQQLPATVALHRTGATDTPASSGNSSCSSSARPGILKRTSAVTSTEVQSPIGGASSSSRGSVVSSSAAIAAAPAASPTPNEHPHYAAVFLTDKSRQALLQHVAPLHEVVSADHMTIAYKPTPEQCATLPLGREAALFVLGVASDYRAQAVVVQYPSWIPYTSESVPHVTVSVGEEVLAREAGDLIAAVQERGDQLAPVARLKLLQGVVGVQLSNGSRTFSVEELQSRLAAAAADRQQRQAAVAAAPSPSSGPMWVLQRGVVPRASAEPATEPAALLAAGAAHSSSSSKAAAWDLDSLMDQLHLADQLAAPTGSSSTGSQAAPQPQHPRRGLLKLPAAVAAEIGIPSKEEAAAATSSGSIRGPARPLVLLRPRSQQAHHALVQRQQQQQQQQALDYGTGGVATVAQWVEPQAAVVVPGKTVAEEAAEAADAPLDMVSSLAFLLPPEPGRGVQAAGVLGAAAATTAADNALLSPRGYASSGSSSEEGSGTAADADAPAVAPIDPELQHLLQLQFPALHELVLGAALHMHGGSLHAAAQFLLALDQQQASLVAHAGLGAAGAPGAAPQQPTLGAYLQHILPNSGLQPSLVAGAGYEAPPSSSSHISSADSSFDMCQQPAGATTGKQPAAFQQRPGPGQALVGRGGGRRGGKGGRAAGGGRRASAAGDDPVSMTERQAMNLHLSAKRLYAQAAQEAFTQGQVALGKKLQATAHSHGDAASSARRRANASAFRTTNAAVLNTFTLDLHGQHVDEAVQSLERYLVTLGGLGHPGGVMLQVITGVGRHSAGNQPRVLPAVVRYLSDTGYKFDSEAENPGVINVMIGC